MKSWTFVILLIGAVHAFFIPNPRRRWQENITPPHPTIGDQIETDSRLLVSGGPPNPTQVSLEALQLPQLAYLEAKSVDILNEIKHGIRYLFQTNNTATLAVTGTGSTGSEVLLVNLVEPGDVVLIFVIGYRSERVGNMVNRLHGIPVIIRAEPGTAFSNEEIESYVEQVKPRLVYAVNGESSSGIFQRVDQLGEICQRHNCLSIVDVVHIAGIQPFFMDKWGIDAAVCNSQKGVGAPVGLAPVSFSPRAVDKILRRTTQVQSINKDYKEWVEANYWQLDLSMEASTLHSLPVLLLYALREALAQICRNGLAVTWARHEELHGYLRTQLMEHFPFLEEHVEDRTVRLVGAVFVKLPGSVNSVEVQRYLLDRHKVDIASVANT